MVDTNFEYLSSVGIQRNRMLLIRVYAPECADQVVKYCAVLRGANGEQITLNASDIDPVHQVELANTISRFTGKAKRIASRWKEFTDFSVQIPENFYCCEVEIIQEVDGVSRVSPWLTRQATLEFRIPLNVDRFKEAFSFKKGRIIDTETSMYAAVDVVKMYFSREKIDKDLVAYVCNSYVIALYKIIENDYADFYNFISEYEDRIFNLIDVVAEGSGVRENKFQALLSVRTAIWHANIQIRNYSDVEKQLSLIVADLMDLKGQFKITFGYNIALGVLLLGARQWKRGDKLSAETCFHLVYSTFQRSVACNTRNLTYFLELEVSHRAAYYALQALSDISEDSNIPDDFCEKVAIHCSRVKKPEFVRLVQDFILS